MDKQKAINSLNDVNFAVTQVQVYYTKVEAAAYTRHAPRTLDYEVARGNLRVFRPAGKKLLFLRNDLDTWIQQRTAGSDLNKIVDEVVAEVAGANGK